jgi:hypothetical protein
VLDGGKRIASSRGHDAAGGDDESDSAAGAPCGRGGLVAWSGRERGLASSPHAPRPLGRAFTTGAGGLPAEDERAARYTPAARDRALRPIAAGQPIRPSDHAARSDPHIDPMYDLT